MNKKFISVLLSFSLIFGTILANAISISFDELEPIETEENSNISFEDIETEETVSEELTNTDSNIYYEEIDSSEATEELETKETVEQLVTFSARTNQEVQVSVTNEPTVDVLLTKRNSVLDMEQVKADILSQLQNLGINTANVRFIESDRLQVDTNAAGANIIFNNWKRIGYPGQWSLITTNGIYTIQNAENTDGNTGFIYPESYDFQDMDISVDLRSTIDDDDVLGLLLRINVTEDSSNPQNIKTSGYILSLGPTYSSNNTYQPVLLRHNNNLFRDGSGRQTSGTVQGGTLLTYAAKSYGWQLNKWTHFEVKVKGNNIKVYRNNVLIIDYTDTSANRIMSGSYGVFSFSQANSQFRNYKAVTYSWKKYEQVLHEPKWRQNAYRILVNVDDEIDKTLTDKNIEGEILSRTLNDQIHFIQWGSNENITESQNFISRNDNKGMFVDSSNYTNCVNETALYIKNLIDQTKESQYVIVGQKTNIDVLPAELKNNASSEDYPQGRWFIHHDYQYFDNNTGLSTQSEFYTPNLLCEFDKPGKYEIYFDDQLVKEIYAHRRPVAEFGMQVNGTSVSLNSESYDLDSNENVGYGKGIASENWYYKESNETIWHNGKLDTIDLEKTYIIKLEVTDKQGESNYTTKYVGSGIPVAAFNYASDTINQYNPLNIRNTSYDPKGLDIVSQEWILRKNGVTVGTYSSPLTDFSSLGSGNYTYTLTVTNSQGIKSEAYTKAFNVVDDNIEPSVIINPTSCDWKTGTQDISVIFSDGESGFQKWRYAITDSQIKPSSGWSDYKTSSSDMITITDTGIQYLHIEALDNARNLLSRTVGTYKIDNEAPIINDIPVTVGNNSAEVKANAIDNHSGIDSYTLTGPSFNKTQKNDTFIVTLPGVYTLTVTDKVGNQTSKEVEVNVYYPITIVWKDENMPPELKPDTIILQAKDGEEVVKEVELPNGTTDYTFKDLPINDDYTFDLIVSDRYDIEVTDQTIVVTYHASNFSVVIPKSITLNGITGTGSYLVKVSGEFFYNDTLTVKPDTGFTLNDRSNISKMTGKVEQTKSVFTKDSLQNARGNISVNRTYFSGIWRGNYHFDVKLVQKN